MKLPTGNNCPDTSSFTSNLKPSQGERRKRRFLEQPEEFEDDHDNENHSNYVKEGSAHAGRFISE
jgi:hypothetical protein